MTNNVEIKGGEPKAIQDRICLPSPMDSVRKGIIFFLEQEHTLAMKRCNNTIMRG